MPTDPVIDGYLKSVAEELDVAERLVQPPPQRLAAFHLQQAAEKLVKAIRLHRRLLPTTEHRIDVLLDALPPSDPWRAKLRPLDDLSEYATTYRYPTPMGRLKKGPAEQDIIADIQAIRALLAEARAECTAPLQGGTP